MIEHLSPHFTLQELTKTGTGLDNTPNAEQRKHLEALAQHLEAVRALVATPVTITSGFRSPAVNKAVSGSTTSAHLRGDAADFTCRGIDPAAICEMIRDSDIPYDQIIDEERNGKRWVHIGFADKPRRQYLRYTGGTYTLIK